MPLETITGFSISGLLAEAQSRIGADAVVISVRETNGDSRRAVYEMLAADPVSAAIYSRSEELTPSDSAQQEPPPLPAPERGRRRRIVALVGPTGAGKTTTAAKLANHPIAFGGRAAGMLCLDTYRIGGVEQSRIYAELSRIPCEVIYEADEIPRALRRLKDCEAIIVDTAGRGPKGRSDAAETQKQLRWLRPQETHLVIPAGLQPRQIRRVIDEHQAYGITHALVTKLDECPEDDAIFEIAAEYSLRIRWTADGQEVPEDLSVYPPLPGSLRAPRRGRSASEVPA